MHARARASSGTSRRGRRPATDRPVRGRWLAPWAVAVWLGASGTALAADAIEGCFPLTVADGAGRGAPRFEDFPARSRGRVVPVEPDVRRQARARQYETALALGAARGPNFAGHYTVVGWGCGTGCVEFAIVDALSGRVTFPSDMRYVDSHEVATAPDEAEPPFLGLRYRLDSALLVVVGAPDEQPERLGITYYAWNGSALRRLRFIPSHKQTCEPPRPSSTTAGD